METSDPTSSIHFNLPHDNAPRSAGCTQLCLAGSFRPAARLTIISLFIYVILLEPVTSFETQ